jgi:threonine dehydratase
LNLSEEEKKKGVTTNSSGNHAGAVSLMAKKFGIKAHIIMPDNSPEIKKNIVKESGASIYYCDPSMVSRE